MTTHSPERAPVLLRRVLFALVLVLAMAAAAWLAADAGRVHAVAPVAAAAATDALGEPAALPLARGVPPSGADPSVPDADAALWRRLSTGVEDVPPSF